jgi:hypothetical protein
MTEINLLNKNTFGKKVLNYFLITVTGLSLYGGGLFLKDTVKHKRIESEFRKSSSAIEEAIKKKDFNLASGLLERLDKTELETKDRVKFDLQLKAGKENEKIEKMISGKKIDAARSYLAQVEKQGIFAGQEIKDIEHKIYMNTEEGLFNTLTNSSGENKSRLCENYLNNYSDGKNKKTVISELLKTEFEIFTGYLMTGTEILKVKNRAAKINLLLDKYSKEKKAFPKNIADKITEGKENYEKVYNQNTGNKISGAGFVKIRPVQDSFDSDFENSRNSMIPSNSVGQVVGFSYSDVTSAEPKEKYFFVRFPSKIYGGVNKEWEKYPVHWKKGKTIEAVYRENELIPVKGLLEPEKKELEEIINRLKLKI